MHISSFFLLPKFGYVMAYKWLHLLNDEDTTNYFSNLLMSYYIYNLFSINCILNHFLKILNFNIY